MFQAAGQPGLASKLWAWVCSTVLHLLLEPASPRLCSPHGGSEEHKRGASNTAHWELLLTSHLQAFQWSKQVTWSQSMGRGVDSTNRERSMNICLIIIQSIMVLSFGLSFPTCLSDSVPCVVLWERWSCCQVFWIWTLLGDCVSRGLLYNVLGGPLQRAGWLIICCDLSTTQSKNESGRTVRKTGWWSWVLGLTVVTTRLNRTCDISSRAPPGVHKNSSQTQHAENGTLTHKNYKHW